MRVELMLLVVLSNGCLPHGAAAIDATPAGSVRCETHDPCSNYGGEGGLLAITFAGVLLGVTSLLVLDRSWLKAR